MGTECSLLGFTPEDNNSMWLLLRPAFPRNRVRPGDSNSDLADEIQSQACDLTLKQGHHISGPLDVTDLTDPLRIKLLLILYGVYGHPFRACGTLYFLTML